jgi:hypothetical protein
VELVQPEFASEYTIPFLISLEKGPIIIASKEELDSSKEYCLQLSDDMINFCTMILGYCTITK